MQTLNRIGLFTLPLLVCVMFAMEGGCVMAQAGATVQLPGIGFRGVRTAASAPDGETTNLGGVSRSRFGQSSQSGVGRFPIRNRFGSRSSSSSSLAAKIIRVKELEQQMLADHAVRKLEMGQVRINGSHAVESKADFITRNVGR